MTWGISNLYIIEAQNGLAKIGCAYEPWSRFVIVRCHSPIPARLIAVWRGTQTQERALHKRFKKYRSHSEWFLIDGSFKTFVESKRGKGLSEPIANWPTIGEWNSNRKTLDARQKISKALLDKYERQKTQEIPGLSGQQFRPELYR